MLTSVLLAADQLSSAPVPCEPSPSLHPPKNKKITDPSRWHRQFVDSQKILSNCKWATGPCDFWELTTQGTKYPIVNSTPLVPKAAAHLVYTLPPPHFFCNIQKPEKLHGFFYIWVCMRRVWIPKIYLEGLDSPYFSLTANVWRELLGGIYWKRQIPTIGTSFDSKVDEAFDLAQFWKHGDPLVYGFERSADPPRAPFLSDLATLLTPEHFESDDLKSLVLWDLSLLNVQVQFDRADQFFVKGKLDAVEWEFRCDRRHDMFHRRGCEVSGSLPPWEQPYDAIRRRWVGRLLDFLRLWPTIKSAVPMLTVLRKQRELDWENHTREEIVLCCTIYLSKREVNLLERELVSVYCQGVFDALGILPVYLFKRPPVMASTSRFLVI